MSGLSSIEDANIRKLKSALEGFNAHDLNKAVECDSESIVNYEPTRPEGVAGKAIEIEAMANSLRAFPDEQFAAEQIIASGDWVAVKGLLTGTNTGPTRVGRRDAKPTFKRFSSRRAVFHRFQNGSIVETYGYFDPREISFQLGWINRGTNRNLIQAIAGVAIMTYQAVLMALLVYGTGTLSMQGVALLFAPFLPGLLLLMLGVRGLRRLLLWHPKPPPKSGFT